MMLRYFYERLGGAKEMEDWECALAEEFDEEDQGLILDKLQEFGKEGHMVVKEVWQGLHRPNAKKLAGALKGRVPELLSGEESGKLERQQEIRPEGITDTKQELRVFFRSLRRQGRKINEQLAFNASPASLQKIQQERKLIEVKGDFSNSSPTAKRRKSEAGALVADSSTLLAQIVASAEKQQTETAEQNLATPGEQQKQQKPAGANLEAKPRSKKRKKDEPTQDLQLEQEQSLAQTEEQREVPAEIVSLRLKGKRGSTVVPGLFRSRVFLRRSYIKLLDLILTALTAGVCHIVVAGSPGVGKSVWMLYLLATAPFDVIILQREDGFIIFTSQQVEVRGNSMIDRLYVEGFDEEGTLLLADSCKPLETQMRTILITGPKAAKYHDFNKRLSPVWFYLPSWSLEELLQANSLQCGQADSVVEEMFSIWGGKARPCLDLKANPADLRDLALALEQKSVKETAMGMSGTELPGKGSYVLVVHTVDPVSLQSLGLDWASRQIRSKVSQALLKMSWFEIQDILQSAEIANPLGKAPSKSLVEPYVIDNLKKKDQSELARPLNMLAVETDEFPSLDIQYVIECDSLETVETFEEDTVYIPTKEDYQSVDAVIAPDAALQITVAKRHPIKLAGLYFAAKALKCEKTGIDLVFIVPEGISGSYYEQLLIDNVPITEEERSAARHHHSHHVRDTAEISREEIEEFIPKIRQWVVGCSFNPVGSSGAEAELLDLQKQLRRITKQNKKLKKQLADTE